MPITTTHDVRRELAGQAYSLVRAEAIDISPDLRRAWDALAAAYPALPPDDYLPNGGKYRFRRFGRFWFEPVSGELTPLPHVDYFQSADINTVTGGIVRKFAPLTPEIFANPYLQALIRFDFSLLPLDATQASTPWTVDVHLIRVVAGADERGEPTPEGIHRDGAEFVTVHLAEFDNVTGGSTTIYDDARQPITTFALRDIHDVYLFADPQVWHSAEPIHPVDPARPGVRSILTFDFHHTPDAVPPTPGRP